MAHSVLVADELHDGADALALLMGGAGYDARAVYSPEETIEVAQAWKPGAAIVAMPFCGARGFQVARRLRDLRGRDIRLVAYSRWDSPADEQRMTQAGFDRVVPRTAPPALVLDALSDEGHLLVMRSVTHTARSLDIMIDLGLSLLALDAGALRFGQVPDKLDRVRELIATVDKGVQRLPLLEERVRIAQRLAQLERELEALVQARKRIEFS